MKIIEKNVRARAQANNQINKELNDIYDRLHNLKIDMLNTARETPDDDLMNDILDAVNEQVQPLETIMRDVVANFDLMGDHSLELASINDAKRGIRHDDLDVELDM